MKKMHNRSLVWSYRADVQRAAQLTHQACIKTTHGKKQDSEIVKKVKEQAPGAESPQETGGNDTSLYGRIKA